MKNVLMILVMLGGFAISASAQAKCEPANCAPCPPGCCIINCGPKGSVATAHEKQGDVLFASLLNADENAAAPSCTMSRKEMKACIKACKSQSPEAVTAGFQPTTSCQGNTVSTKVKSTPQKVSFQKS